MFPFPSLKGVRVGLLLWGSRLCRLCGLSLGRSGLLVSHFGLHLFAGVLAYATTYAPLGHTPLLRLFQLMGGSGRLEVTLLGHCHRP